MAGALGDVKTYNVTAIKLLFMFANRILNITVSMVMAYIKVKIYFHKLI